MYASAQGVQAMRVDILPVVVFTAIFACCTGSIGSQGAASEADDAAGEGGEPGTGGKEGPSPPNLAELKSGARFARLTHFQWENSVKDFLRLKQLPSTGLSLQSDAVVGFDNNNSGTALDVSSDLRTDYE